MGTLLELLLAAAIISLVSAQTELQFPGNISSFLYLQGAAQNESDQIILRPGAAGENFTAAFYVQGFSELIFSSSFVFQMLGGPYVFGFTFMITSYNYPNCYLSSTALVYTDIYSCEQVMLSSMTVPNMKSKKILDSRRRYGPDERTCEPDASPDVAADFHHAHPGRPSPRFARLRGGSCQESYGAYTVKRVVAKSLPTR